MRAVHLPPAALPLAQLPEFHALRNPGAMAVVFEGAGTSYAEWSQRTELAAAWLWHSLGVRKGDRVAWLGFNHPDQITLLFALARIGALLVPLNYRLAPAEWDAVLRDCEPQWVLHDAAWAQAAQATAVRHDVSAHLVTEMALDTARPAPVRPDAAVSADWPVLLVYTSGTTGAPKGAVHTQGNLLANMRAAQQVQALAPTDVVLTVLPLFHVGGLCIQTLPALYAGARVLLHARFDPAATLACIAHDRPSLTLLVPATMKALIDHPTWAQTDLRCLRAVWAGSSTLEPALVDAFHARVVPVCNVYGATETGPFSVALDAAHALSHAGSCGWPAPGVALHLADARDGVGELWLRAPHVVRHYWPHLPAVDAEGWFHSGDLATQAADGSWRIVGRAKDMIISGGENIYPAEIENLLATHPDVAECTVLGLPDPQWGEAVVAVVVGRPGVTLDVAALSAFLAGRLARYKQPRRYVVQASLPKTALGKVQKGVLRQTLT